MSNEYYDVDVDLSVVIQVQADNQQAAIEKVNDLSDEELIEVLFSIQLDEETGSRAVH